MKVAKLFFELIRYSIKGDKLSDETLGGVREEQLNSLFVLSKKHDCAHLVTYALFENGLLSKDHPSYQKLVYEQSLAVFRYENINYELNQVCEFLDKHCVVHIPLKGSVIRSFYPQPWMRTSCDIDILIKSEERERVVQLLTDEYGCKLDSVFDYEISLYTPRNVHLEIHLNLVAERQDKIIDDVLSGIWESSTVRDGYSYSMEISDAMFYFYHVAHLSKHFCASGCGVRPFIDLWLLNNVKEYDQDKRDELLERGKLAKFDQGAKKVVAVWLDGEKHDEISKEIEDYVLQAGVYGIKENWKYYYQNKNGGKLRYALSRIFLSFKELCKYYPSLEKHKWLYPFYQVRRWFKILFCGGVKRSVKELNEIKNLSNDTYIKREKMMNNLGLWK
ncbi:MAG: nucleotidyltransferase family protein [Clostridia bacterium]|nr:nucleotidyltransferase family protein [Clostridia bacterium]